jgi:hypothetical protein
MKYILLVHHPKGTFDAPKDPADVAAGRAYGAALHAAGIFVAGAGLESPQNATSVSVRDAFERSASLTDDSALRAYLLEQALSCKQSAIDGRR